LYHCLHTNRILFIRSFWDKLLKIFFNISGGSDIWIIIVIWVKKNIYIY
jgi:hypothetical protein